MLPVQVLFFIQVAPSSTRIGGDVGGGGRSDLGQGAEGLVFVELVLYFLDPEGDDFGLKVVFYFPDVVLIKGVKFFFLGFEGLQDFTFNNVVSLLLHLADDKFEFFDFVEGLHKGIPGSFDLVSNNVGGFVYMLNPVVDVILDEGV
jgi:hypothetical protein